MFCILHQYCPKAGANGHCTAYANSKWWHTLGITCPVATTPEQRMVMATSSKKKAINALKESKRKAAGA